MKYYRLTWTQLLRRVFGRKLTAQQMVAKWNAAITDGSAADRYKRGLAKLTDGESDNKGR